MGQYKNELTQDLIDRAFAKRNQNMLDAIDKYSTAKARYNRHAKADITPAKAVSFEKTKPDTEYVLAKDLVLDTTFSELQDLQDYQAHPFSKADIETMRKYVTSDDEIIIPAGTIVLIVIVAGEKLLSIDGVEFNNEYINSTDKFIPIIEEDTNDEQLKEKILENCKKYDYIFIVEDNAEQRKYDGMIGDSIFELNDDTESFEMIINSLDSFVKSSEITLNNINLSLYYIGFKEDLNNPIIAFDSIYTNFRTLDSSKQGYLGLLYNQISGDFEIYDTSNPETNEYIPNKYGMTLSYDELEQLKDFIIQDSDDAMIPLTRQNEKTKLFLKDADVTKLTDVKDIIDYFTTVDNTEDNIIILKAFEKIFNTHYTFLGKPHLIYSPEKGLNESLSRKHESIDDYDFDIENLSDEEFAEILDRLENGDEELREVIRRKLRSSSPRSFYNDVAWGFKGLPHDTYRNQERYVHSLGNRWAMDNYNATRPYFS